MKRNKLKAKGLRTGVSPYHKYRKRPCPTCQAITKASRYRASGGREDRVVIQ